MRPDVELFETRNNPKVAVVSPSMKTFLMLLGLATVTACAETTVIPSKQPEKFPLNFRLALPKEDSAVVSHKQEDGAEVITARLEDDRKGKMVVEAVDSAGKRVWHHDFGYNFSAAPGCSVSVQFHPDLMAVIVSYHGYKWDNAYKLLFVEKHASGHVIREYPKDAQEIRAYIEKLPDFSKGFKYWIHPQKFVGQGLEFECIPLTPPDSNAPHPLAQDGRWFNVKASLDKDFLIVPTGSEGRH